MHQLENTCLGAKIQVRYSLRPGPRGCLPRCKIIVRRHALRLVPGTFPLRSLRLQLPPCGFPSGSVLVFNAVAPALYRLPWLCWPQPMRCFWADLVSPTRRFPTNWPRFPSSFIWLCSVLTLSLTASLLLHLLTAQLRPHCPLPIPNCPMVVAIATKAGGKNDWTPKR